ncbi:MAG: CDP-glycerol glycerophosphotransferase family protein [Oscillospiraceae bacterium]|nr:CDP-glycerol glycerophosphotransferase family protein [Oscillospiraceae bacterium]MBQ3528964.1 CDP-glycerol glycerophosphotransferase family protein [Oscillospiraceae bacterium]
MKFWEKGRIRPRIKRVLLKAYNAFWEVLPFFKKKYLWLYCTMCSVKPKKVVFSNFFGKPYGDNPKYIAEELLKRCPGWDLVWLLDDINSPLPQGIRPVRFGSDQAMKEMASAKFLVVNIRNIRRPKKKKKQTLLQTWHGGMGFKAIESAVPSLDAHYIKRAKQDGKDSDAIISSCDLVSEIYREYFWLNKKTKILEIGLPRNDKLFDAKAIDQTAAMVRASIGIDADVRIVLYMPTFRDDGSTDGYNLDYPAIIDAFEKRFEQKFVLIVRLHPNVKEQDVSLQSDKRITSATHYPDAQELYMVADYLITDYSSAAFDFALLDRPVFLCALDYEKYRSTRGLTKMFEECPFDRSFSSEELVEHICTFSLEEYDARMKEFSEYCRSFDRGDAAQRAVDWMLTKNT